MDRFFNLAWISGGTINLLQFIKLIHINEVIVVVTGLLGITLLIYQIINKHLQNRDLREHLKKEQLDIESKRLDIKEKKNKYKNAHKTSK